MQYSSTFVLSNKFRRYVYAALLAVFLVMLFFGLRPKSPPLNDNFTFLLERKAAQFAYPSMLLVPSPSIPSLDEGDKLNLHLVFMSEDTKNTRLRFLVQLRSDEPKDDFVIAQWKNSLMIMNGDDFSNVKRQPKIYAEIPTPHHPVLLSIISDNRGTWVYFDGLLVSYNRNLILELPDSYSNALILGNSEQGDHPWLGHLYGINLFYTPDEQVNTVLRHNQEWEKERSLPTIAGNKVITNLNFTKEQTENLMLVKKTPFADRSVLKWPATQISKHRFPFIIDIIVNFIGFMPFGFLLMLLILTKTPLKYRLLSVSCISFSFSLCIEISQIWIPIRDSSSLDLLLNTSGGLAGGLCCALLLANSEKIRSAFKLFKK